MICQEIRCCSFTHCQKYALLHIWVSSLITIDHSYQNHAGRLWHTICCMQCKLNCSETAGSTQGIGKSTQTKSVELRISRIDALTDGGSIRPRKLLSEAASWTQDKDRKMETGRGCNQHQRGACRGSAVCCPSKTVGIRYTRMTQAIHFDNHWWQNDGWPRGIHGIGWDTLWKKKTARKGTSVVSCRFGCGTGLMPLMVRVETRLSSLDFALVPIQFGEKRLL